MASRHKQTEDAILMDNFGVLKEAIRRSLSDGLLLPGRPLNIPQREALINYHTFLDEPPVHDRIDRRRGYFDMATGTGKTGLFSVIARHAHLTAQEWGRADSFKTVVVEPTTLLLKQTYDESIAIAPELRRSIGVFGDGSKDLNRPITIMTFDAWAELTQKGHLQDVSFEIMDESHYGLSDLRQRIRRERLNNAMHMGVTASAQYDSQKTMETTHQNLIYKIDLKNAIERGFLTDYAHVQFGMMRILPSLTDREDQKLARGEFPALKQREWSILATQTYATMRDEVNQQPLSDKIAAFFTANTYHAEKLAYMLNSQPLLQQKAKANGFKDVAITVHSVGYTPAEQDRRLEAFKAGEYMAIVGDKKIQAGFDHPPLKFAACYPGNSLVDTVQEIGRATRRYIDPNTGVSQGTVIFESIPYLGFEDSEEDKKSRSKALANTKTAYEILKGTVVYSPTYMRPIEESDSSGPTRMLISPTCTAEIYTSEHDTLLISRLIDDARIEELRVDISPEMLADLKHRISLRGNYGGMRLMNEVERYEIEKGLEGVGLVYWDITSILGGGVKSMQISKWQRLNEVINEMPLVDFRERIAVTPKMLSDLKDEIVARGGYSYVRLMAEVEKYEAEEKLLPCGITQPTVARIISGEIKTVEALQWQRLRDVVAAMPLQEVGERKEISDAMIVNFREKVAARGRFGAVRLTREIKKYEAERKLPDSGMTEHTIARLLLGYMKTMPIMQWQRLNEVVDAIPSLRVGDYTTVTLDMMIEFRAKLMERGALRARRLMQEVRKYEGEHGLHAVLLQETDIARLLKGTVTKNMQTTKWQRLNEVISSIPLSASRPRIELTPPVMDEFRKKVAAHGGFGNKRLMAAVEQYEENKSEPSVGLTAPIIQTIFEESIRTVDAEQWARINAVLDSLPLYQSPERRGLTSEMAIGIKEKVELKGNYGAMHLMQEVSKFETEKKLQSVGLSDGIIQNIISGKLRTVEVEQWNRLNAVLEAMPTIEGRARLAISSDMLVALTAKIDGKGGYGALRLVGEIQEYEVQNNLNSVGITPGILGSVLFERSVKTMASAQWTRLNAVLDAMPEVKAPDRTDIAPKDVEELKRLVNARGGFGPLRLMSEVESYESRHKLPSVKLTQQLINHTLGGRAKSLKTDQWLRLKATITELPLQERHERLEITETMLSDLNDKINARGGYGFRLLFQELEPYERKNQLLPVELSESKIAGVISGKLKSASAVHWRRLNELVESLPLRTVASRIDITSEKLAEIQGNVASRGNPGAVRLSKEVERYEQENNLLSINLNKDTIARVLSGKYRTIEESQWQRLNDVLQELPLMVAREKIPVTTAMIEDIKKKIRERGNLRAQRLYNLSEETDHPVKLTFNYINGLINGPTTASTYLDQWERLNQVVDGLPIDGPLPPKRPRKTNRADKTP